MKFLTPLFWAISTLVFARLLDRPLIDYDLWFHLNAGRGIVETRAFPMVDIVSHATRGALYLNFEWLSAVLFYLTWKVAGYAGLYAGKIALGLAVVAGVALAARRTGLRGFPLLLVTFVAGLVLKSRLNERPELFTFALLALWMAVILAARSDARFRSPKALAGLAFAMVLWTNLHGGFVFGLAVALLAALGSRWAGEKKDYTGFLDRLVVVSLVCTFVNPFGARIYQVLVEHLVMAGRVSAGVSEWAPTTIAGSPWFWCFFLLAAAGIVFGLLKRRPWARFWTPLVLPFAVWGTLHTRNSALLAFVAAPLLGDLAKELGVSLKKGAKAMAPIAGACLCVLLAAHVPHLLRPRPRSVVAWEHFPVGALGFLDEAKIDGTMYNSFEFGGFISWLAPRRPIFFDGRSLSMPMVVEEISNFSGATPGDIVARWQKYLERHGVTYAVTRYPLFRRTDIFENLTPLNYMFPRDRWALVYWDDASLVFLKRTPANQAQIKAREYKVLRPYNLYQMSEMLRLKLVAAREVLAELDRNEAQVGPTEIGARLRPIVAAVGQRS